MNVAGLTKIDGLTPVPVNTRITDLGGNCLGVGLGLPSGFGLTTEGAGLALLMGVTVGREAAPATLTAGVFQIFMFCPTAC